MTRKDRIYFILCLGYLLMIGIHCIGYINLFEMFSVNQQVNAQFEVEHVFHRM